MLPSVLLAILGFAFVVIVHELGHFLFAKWAGVKVIRFAVGFPPIVWEKQVGETSYAIGLIWAGGYVRMLGEEDADAKNDPRSLINARPGWRALILLGGVLFNLISSWLLLVALGWYGMPITPPVVAGIAPDMADPLANERRMPSPAVQLGLRLGDEIRSVNGIRTRSFEDVFSAVGLSGGEPVTVVVRRDGQDLTLGEGAGIHAVKAGGGRGLPVLGIEGPAGFRVEQIVDALGETPKALLGRGWVLDQVEGKSVEGRLGQEVQRELEPRVGQMITCIFVRGEERYQTTFRYAGTSSPRDLAIGLPVRVTSAPVAGMPAKEAGLRAGDVVIAVDGTTVSGLGHFNALVQTAAVAGRAMQLTVRRGQESLDLSLTAQRSPDGRSRLGLPIGPMVSGVVPVIPATIAGGPGGLGRAGIAVGDTLLDLRYTEVDAKAKTVPAWVVRGGEPRILPLSGKPTVKELGRISERLVGRRVLERTPESVRLADSTGAEGSPIAIVDLPAAVTATVAAVEPGDWIVRVGEYGDGHALEIVRGASAEAQLLAVPLDDGGLAMEFQKLTRPYVLEYPSEPFAIANHAAWRMVVDTLSIIPKFFRPSSADGLDATKTLSGPVGIFSILMDRFQRDGFAAWLHIVALIGLNLFLVNLLPIPVVDGGQLVQLGVEVAMRRPLPDRVKGIINAIGFAMVVSLMLFALSLDILRKFGWL